MSWFVVDVESDGPCPGLFSMVSFGAVRVDRDLQTHDPRRRDMEVKLWKRGAVWVAGVRLRGDRVEAVGKSIGSAVRALAALVGRGSGVSR